MLVCDCVCVKLSFLLWDVCVGASIAQKPNTYLAVLADAVAQKQILSDLAGLVANARKIENSIKRQSGPGAT